MTDDTCSDGTERSKWNICPECGYEIRDSDDVACNIKHFEFLHERCIPSEVER